MNIDALNVISCALNNENNKFHTNNWEVLLKELADQSVLALPYEYILKQCNDSQFLSLYKNKVLFNVTYYLRVAATQEVIIKALSENDIKSVILKGTSVAKYYPKPEYRAMGDIDLLVLSEDFDKAHAIFLKQGFNVVPDFEEYERHIVFLNNQGVEVELHRYFSSIGTEEQRTYLDNRLLEGMKNSVGNVLPEVENGLVLIGHVAQHLGSGLGLRQIIDWMMYVKANLTDSFWQDEFSEPARMCGFDTLAKVATALCCKYFGLDMGITWCSDANEATVDALMEYVMSQGNFGRKRDNKERTTATVMNNFRNPIAFFKYLQDGGKTHWKLARENKFVGCFAWLYQIGHIIKMGFTKKIGIKNLKNSREESNSIVRLMNDLNITDY